MQVLQKFKVRIEDPPRRRHMVFLGGAVLANIVGFTLIRSLAMLTRCRWQTRRTCGYQRRNGRSRAPEHWRSWVQDDADAEMPEGGRTSMSIEASRGSCRCPTCRGWFLRKEENLLCRIPPPGRDNLCGITRHSTVAPAQRQL